MKPRRHQWRRTRQDELGHGMHDVCTVCGIFRRQLQGRFGSYYVTAAELDKGGPNRAPPCVPGRYADCIRVHNPTDEPVVARVFGQITPAGAKLVGILENAHGVAPMWAFPPEDAVGPWHWHNVGESFELKHVGRTWMVAPIAGDNVRSLTDAGRRVFEVRRDGIVISVRGLSTFPDLHAAMRAAELDASIPFKTSAL